MSYSSYATSLTSVRPFGGFQDVPGTAQGSSKAKVAQKPHTLDLPALQVASRLVQDQFIKDAQIIPDLGEMIAAPGGSSSASYTVFPGDFRVPFQKRKHVGIPPELWEHFQSSKFVCSMGLLTEIDRAWITLDHKLFLWDYVEGQELSSFVEQPDVISHVALVKPRPGVFIDEITHLLVICTPVSVLLLGLSVENARGPDNRPHKAIKLYATDMSVPTDGIEMTSVVGTNAGRIFMCGIGDGNMYELHYQEKEVWFGKRVHLINHSASGLPSFIPLLRSSATEERIISLVADNNRDCIYSLSDNNWISIWKPEPNKTLRKLQTLSNLHKQAQDKAPGASALTQPLKLLSIHATDPKETKSGVHLIALAANGVRLYFSQSQGGFSYSFGSPNYGPGSQKQLQLVHVRLPPMNLIHPDEQLSAQYQRLPQSIYGQPAVQQQKTRPVIISNLSTSSYVDGTLVAAQPSDVDGKDFILGVAPDLSRIGSLGQAQAPVAQPPPTSYYGQVTQQRPPLTEQATLMYIEGTVWAIANAPRATPSSMSATPAASPEPLATNELSRQLSEPPQEFIVVTNVGVSFLTKRRALDYLRDAIEEVAVDGNLHSVYEFRDSFGRNQTCAMLLALASGNTFISPDRSGYSIFNDVVALSPDLQNVAKQAFYEIGEKPVWVDRGFTGDGQGGVFFSGRRDGLALYLSRLVKPIWRAKIAKAGGQSSNFADPLLVTIQRNLFSLKTFLDQNPQLFSSAPGEQVASRQNTEHDPWKIEYTSAQQLQELISRTIEAISFVLLLVDYNFADLVSRCDKDTQAMIANLTYEELITAPNGLHVSRALVNVIIDKQIGQQLSVDTVSEILQQRCGSFCSADDVMLYKARENVRKAADVTDPTEKLSLLSESLRLFSRAAHVIEFEKLQEICGDYQHLSYAKGAVELPLQCAGAADPDNISQEYWMAGCPSGDPRSEYLQRRLRYYDLVLDSLNVFDERCNTSIGPAQQESEEIRNLAFDTAFTSVDPIFHSHLYEWMVQRGMTDALLEIRPPFLEAHLRREPVTAENYQLLWQLYVKNGQYLASAEILSILAQTTEFDIPLENRLEFLTLAVSNAKSHPVSVNGRHETAIAFLTELEDRLEVAQVQMEIFHALLPRISEEGEVGLKIQALNQRLFDITELYQFYAEPFNLPGIKLLILHVSEHRDDAVVKPIWNELFEEAQSEGTPDQQADKIASAVINYGRRFYPSEYAFPLRHISSLLVRFTIQNRGVRPAGWAPRILKEAGVYYAEIWDVLHEMYESQVPPFNEQENVQAISSDIAILLKDWVEDARQPQSSLARGDFPVDLLDRTITKYIEELRPDRKETKAAYEDVKRQLRRYW